MFTCGIKLDCLKKVLNFFIKHSLVIKYYVLLRMYLYFIFKSAEKKLKSAMAK